MIEERDIIENANDYNINLIECNDLKETSKTGQQFQKINQRISDLLDKEFEIPLKIDQSMVKSKNFIFTDNAIKKLKEIKYYLSHNYPVLLEGPTGTAKTKSVEILCEEMGLKLKRFNLSSETKTADLFGRYAGDPDSLSGISFKEGIFIEAFRKGYTLLLDEINLASNQVLQSFEECLDSHKISCEIPGMSWKEIEMGKGFNIIATQNPNKGLFANKRQELGKKFLSRFHIINFDSFQKKELLEIAKGLGNKCEPKISDEIINDLVNFHFEWSNLKERKNDILCFTIREIEATINAISKGENIREAILCIYGSRYKEDQFDQLKSIIDNSNKYPNLRSNNNKIELPLENEVLYITPQLEKVLKAIKLSFENSRHIMIIGDEGTGKSQIAKYIAEKYDKKNDIEDDGICYCECTEDLKCSDLIGNQYPSLNITKDNSQELMIWKDGFLTLSILKGKCCILDNIEEAPVTITERLNGLLDKKLNLEEELIFEIPECPQTNEIPINKNFRLICICNYDSINKMSPAFLNRFDIITLEDQIKPFYTGGNSKENLLKLIDTLMKQHSSNYIFKSNLSQEKDNKKDIIKNMNQKNKKNYNKYLGNIDNIVTEKKQQEKTEFKYEKNDDLNKLIYNKVLECIKNYKTSEEKKKKEMKNRGNESNNYYKLSMYKLSLFCRAVFILSKELSPKKEIDYNKLVNYAFQLVVPPVIKDDPEIENIIFKKYLNHDLRDPNDSIFYFQNSSKIKSFMAKLLAASMINLHICIIGKTGIGKTSCARQFSRIRQKSMNLSKDFYMHSFHSNTKPSHFYGNITMKNNEIDFINGSLLNAMELGTTFIADEMNLSPDLVMKSLVPTLDLNYNCKIYIPGVIEKVKINPNFFFIACQNDFNTTGRNSLPKLLEKKIRRISYPEPPLKEIQYISYSINLDLYGKLDIEKRTEIYRNAENIATYMDMINKKKELSFIPNWSIRDITKILKRVHFQSLEHNKYKYRNISFIDNIVFYTLSGIYKRDIKDKKEKEKLIDKILNILKPLFKIHQLDIPKIKENYMKDAIITKDYIMKGECGISLQSLHSFDKIKKNFRLPSLYNELFNILLALDEEPILIIGESGYKTYLAQLILKDSKPIQLNAETTIGQLLGTTIFLSDSEAKIFYLKQIYNILNIALNDKDIQMVQKWVNYNDNDLQKIMEEQKNFIKAIDKEINQKILVNSKISKFIPTIDILKKKLVDNNKTKKNKLNDINLEFKPGLILDSILSGKSLILKYLSNLSTVVLERFNELFSGSHNLTLNEDVHDTFTKEGKKEFSNLGENFRIFATCSLGQQNKLSEAVLSRFTIICSDKYSPEEQKDVLESFLYDKKLTYDESCIEEIIDFANVTKKYSLTQMINALSLSNQKELFQEEEISRVNILSFFYIG